MKKAIIFLTVLLVFTITMPLVFSYSYYYDDASSYSYWDSANYHRSSITYSRCCNSHNYKTGTYNVAYRTPIASGNAHYDNNYEYHVKVYKIRRKSYAYDSYPFN